MKRTSILAAGVLASTLAAGTVAMAQGGPPPSRGPGMMGDAGPPAAQGGYGPGMMGGGGYGPGMMGGGGYGPGATGGYGYGPGRAGAQGAPRWGRGGGLAALDLTDAQRDKLAALHEQTRQKSWDTMGQLRTEQFKLRQMLRGDTVDPAAAIDQQRKVDDLRRQLMKTHLEMRNEMVAVLTPEQRTRLRELGPWWIEHDRDD